MSSRHETIYFHKCLALAFKFKIMTGFVKSIRNYSASPVLRYVNKYRTLFSFIIFGISYLQKKIHVTSEFKLSKKLKNKEYEISATVAFHFLSKNVAVYNCTWGLSSQKAVV